MDIRTERILGITITTYANRCVGQQVHQYIAKNGNICAKMEHKIYALRGTFCRHVHAKCIWCVQGAVNLRGRSGTIFCTK